MADQPVSAAPFVDRHVGPSPQDEQTMLSALGIADEQALLERAVPASIRLHEALGLDAGRSEPEVTAELRALAGRNRVLASMIGQGYYGTHVPAVVKRNVLENPAWYTAYTPYQPEISQGRLEALLNFQTAVCDLTGLATANSSLLDEATAAAEAMTLMRRSTKVAADAVLVVDAGRLHRRPSPSSRPGPSRWASRSSGRTCPGRRTRPPSWTACWGSAPCSACWSSTRRPAGGWSTCRRSSQAVHERGALVTVAADLLALTLVRAPGELGADVAVGTSQRFGVPMGFGGPHAGYMSVRKGLERGLPGRLVGVSVDADGDPAYRLALQTREQHIRREKATSNICTAQVLLAVMASMYAVYHGPEGLAAIARGVHRRAASLADALRALDGVDVVHDAFFDTVLARVPGRAAEVVAAAAG